MTGWLKKRGLMRRDMARAFSARSGICSEDFLRIFYDPIFPPLVGDFDTEYIPDASVVDEILADLGRSTGLALSVVKSYFTRSESFAQFGEHLLRAGAYAAADKR
jgi:hypothetical protein